MAIGGFIGAAAGAAATAQDREQEDLFRNLLAMRLDQLDQGLQRQGFDLMSLGQRFSQPVQQKVVNANVGALSGGQTGQSFTPGQTGGGGFHGYVQNLAKGVGGNAYDTNREANPLNNTWSDDLRTQYARSGNASRRIGGSWKGMR